MKLDLMTYRYGVASAFGLAIFFLTYAVVGAPTRVASRLGMRGLKRRRAIDGNSSWSQVEPLVRWLGVRVSGILSDSLRISLDRQIALAGDYLGLTPEEYVGLSIVGFLGGLLGGSIFGIMTGLGAVTVILGAMIGAAAPYLQISGEAQRRQKQINRGLPYAVDLMALAMSAGLDFPGSMRQVVEKSSDPEDALVEELTRILQELSLGRTRRQAMLEFSQRVPSEPVQEFVNAVIQAEERGNPVAEVLLIQAGISRMRRGVKAEESAAKAGVQMVLPLFLLFGCIMLLVVAPMIIKLVEQE